MEIKIRSANSYKELNCIAKIIEKEIWNRYVKQLFQTWIKSRDFQLEHTSLAEVDGEIVSFAVFIPETIEIGISLVKLAYIEFCFTRQKFRGKAIFPKVFHYLLENIGKLGYPMARLLGDYGYARFGFVPCFYHNLITFNTTDIKERKANYFLRRMRQNDIESSFKLQQDNTANSIIKTKDAMEAILRYHPYRKGLFVVEDKSSHENTGYLWIRTPRQGRFWVEEVVVKDKEAFEAILSNCANIANRLGLRKISFCAPLNCNFTNFCQKKGAEINLSTDEIEFKKSGGDIIKIVSIIGILKNLEAELNRRYKNSEYKSWNGRIAIQTEKEIATLELRNNGLGIDLTRKPQDYVFKISNKLFTWLIMGFKDINEIMQENNINISPSLIGIFSAVFPKGAPYSANRKFPSPELIRRIPFFSRQNLSILKYNLILSMI